jgi:hypothetical protein
VPPGARPGMLVAPPPVYGPTALDHPETRRGGAVPEGLGAGRGRPPHGGHGRGAAVEVKSGNEDGGAIETGGAKVEDGDLGDLSAPTQEQEVGGIDVRSIGEPGGSSGGAHLALERVLGLSPPPELSAKRSAANVGLLESTPKRRPTEALVMNSGSTVNEPNSSPGRFLLMLHMNA